MHTGTPSLNIHTTPALCTRLNLRRRHHPWEETGCVRLGSLPTEPSSPDCPEEGRSPCALFGRNPPAPCMGYDGGIKFSSFSQSPSSPRAEVLPIDETGLVRDGPPVALGSRAQILVGATGDPLAMPFPPHTPAVCGGSLRSALGPSKSGVMWALLPVTMPLYMTPSDPAIWPVILVLTIWRFELLTPLPWGLPDAVLILTIVGGWV